MRDDDRVASAGELVHEAALFPDAWSAALQALCDLSGSASASIVVFHGGRTPAVASTGAVGAVLEELIVREDWLDSYSVTRVIGAAPPHFIYDEDFFPPDMLEGDPLRRPMLRRHGLGGQTATMLRLATGENVLFTFEHGLGGTRPDARVLGLLDSFRPHLARAALTSARLRLRAAQDAVATLAGLGMPAAVIDRHARVVAANARMEALPGAFRTGARDRLSLPSPAAQALLAEALAHRGPGPVVRSFPMPLDGEDGAPVVVLHLVPLRRAASDLFGRADLLVVATVAAVGSGAPGPEVLESLFDLTPAEARLAAALGQGLSLREAAVRCGIGFGSARTCLERVFRKTGTNRQAQLVGMLTAAHPFRSET